jgi:hypothetical protein
MTYSKEKGHEHYRNKSDGKECVREVYHIQNVNRYNSLGGLVKSILR